MLFTTNLGDLVCDTRTDNQELIYDIEWTVGDFTETFESKTIGKFRVQDVVVDVPGSEFQLKMLIAGTGNDLVEIYYLSTTSVHIKSKLRIIYSVGNGPKSDKIIKYDNYQTVQASEWQYLGTFYRLDNNYGKENDLWFLYFEFIVSSYVRDERHDILSGSALRLREDLGKLLASGSDSDVTMTSIEGEEFKVHKPLLSARSEVLRAHFEHGTTETVTNVIRTSFGSEVLRDVLTYIYTDNSKAVDTIPEQLLEAADFYQLSGLKILCEEVLRKRLTVENAIETLQYAELYSVNSLQISTLEFIKNHRMQSIMQTQGWAKIQSVEMLKKICEFALKD